VGGAGPRRCLGRAWVDPATILAVVASAEIEPDAEPLTREEALAMRGTGWVVAPDPPAETGPPDS
jgi:hypothetical protein